MPCKVSIRGLGSWGRWRGLVRSTALWGPKTSVRLRFPFPPDLATFQSWGAHRWELPDPGPPSWNHCTLSPSVTLYRPDTDVTRQEDAERQLFEHRGEISSLRHRPIKFSRQNGGRPRARLCLREQGSVNNRRSTRLTIAFTAKEASRGVANRASM